LLRGELSLLLDDLDFDLLNLLLEYLSGDLDANPNDDMTDLDLLWCFLFFCFFMLLAMTRFWWSNCGNRSCEISSAFFAAFISACWMLWPIALANRRPRKYTATVYTLVLVGPLHSITLQRTSVM
jgi:hypothetical protein